MDELGEDQSIPGELRLCIQFQRRNDIRANFLNEIEHQMNVDMQTLVGRDQDKTNFIIGQFVAISKSFIKRP